MADFTISDKTQAQTLATGTMFLVETGTAGQYGKYPWSTLSGQFNPSNGPSILIGSGNPEGIVAAVSGSIYTDYFNRTFYQKISGDMNNPIGWI